MQRRGGPALLALLVALVAGFLALRRGGGPGEPGPRKGPAPGTAAGPAEPARPPTAAAPAAAPPEAGAAPAAPAPAPDAPCSKVAGAVFEAGGLPAAGVLVWEGENFGPGGDRVLTDENGRYEIALPDGPRVVRARGQGTGTASAEVQVPLDGSPVRAPDLLLPAGGVIRGTVVDRDGKPLPWVRVRCWAEEGEPGEALQGGKRFLVGGDDVLTDDRGNFALRGLDPVPHRVYPEIFDHPVLKSDPPEVKGVKPDGEPLRFRLAGAARVRGLVVDGETGEPLPCFSVAGTLFDRPDGRFETEVGEEPEFGVLAPGYGPAKFPVKDPAGEEGERRLPLARAGEAGTLTLLVSGEGGEPIEGLRAHLVAPDFHSWVRAWTGPAREFRFGRVPAGALTVFVQAEGWSPATLAVEVAAGGEAKPETKLRRCGSARVRLLDPKGNVLRHPRSVVLLDAEGKGPPVRWIYTRPQGTLMPIAEFQWTGGPEGTELILSEGDGRLAGLLPGSYRLRVRQGDLAKEAAFSVPAGGEVEVTVRLGE